MIAAITSCTNTSNPSVMVAAGLLAKKAVERGLDDQAVGQGQPGPRLEGRHRLPRRRRARRSIWTGSGSTWSATAARPASAIPARCPSAISEAIHRRRPGGRGRPERQPQLRGPDQPRRPRQLPGLAARWWSPTPWPARWTSTSRTTRWATTRAASRSTSRISGPASARSRTTIQKSVRSEMFQQRVRRGLSRATSTGARCRCPKATSTSGTTASTYVKNPPYFAGMTDRAAAGRADRRGAGAGGAGRQHHDRPHLAGRFDQGGQPGGPLPDRARRQASPTSTPTAPGGATTR